jgi:hypothetical protein
LDAGGARRTAREPGLNAIDLLKFQHAEVGAT